MSLKNSQPLRAAKSSVLSHKFCRSLIPLPSLVPARSKRSPNSFANHRRPLSPSIATCPVSKFETWNPNGKFESSIEAKLFWISSPSAHKLTKESFKLSLPKCSINFREWLMPGWDRSLVKAAGLEQEALANQLLKWIVGEFANA